MSTITDVEVEPCARVPRRSRLHPIIPGFHNQPPFKIWFHESWLDILTQLLLLLAAQLIYLFAKPILPRYFPLYEGVQTSAWGVAHGKPVLEEYITTLVSAVVSFAIPFAIMGAIGLWGVRDFWESNAAIMGLGYALGTATLCITLIKWFIGGLRPHFLAYTASVCTGDAKLVKEAQMSFPSGHSSAAFAGFGFLALYLNSKLKVIGRKGDQRSEQATEGEEDAKEIAEEQRTSHWKLVACVAPWLVALLIAASKVRDEWHHPVDVLFGSFVGIVFAHMAFHCTFRGVYDGRVNHMARD